jgi:P-type Cu+ transporter
MSQERRVPSELIQKGDYVKVVPGERIAADGVVVRGESTVDESMVTGEVLSIGKGPGSNVIGGTVNALGTFDFVVTRAGKETSLSQIVRLVSDAQTSKAPIQALADRVAGIFVPSVVLLGAITFIFWMCISHLTSGSMLPDVFHQVGSTKLMVCLKLCISVVVVACPCALGLSTPTAVMVGTGVGAQNGILIKGGGPLEASNTIGCVMFDKTGTLTKGRLAVSSLCWHDGEIQLFDERKSESHDDDLLIDRKVQSTQQELRQSSVSGLSQGNILEIIAAAERKSEHPLARAIALFLDSRVGRPHQVEIKAFESVSGGGVRCIAMSSGIDHKVVIGSAEFVLGKTTSIGKDARQFADEQQARAHSTVYAAIDGSLACILALADQLKPEARQCIDGLRRMGIRCGLITGDSRATARAIARELAIDDADVYAEMSPNGKRSIIVKLREQLQLSSGMKNGVAMVGDGINDSPALAAATLGIAVGGGTEIAMEAASIVLMRASLLDVAASLHLSRRIFRQIKLNYVWATVYNVLFIPLAMGAGLPWGIHLHPMMAGAAMAFSSVSVVLSSLTLKRWRRPEWLRSAEGDVDLDSDVAMGPDAFARDGASASLLQPLSAAASDLAARPFGTVSARSSLATRALDAIFGVIAPHRKNPLHSTQGYESVAMEAV